MKAFPMKRTILAITAGAMCATSAWADETNSLPTLTLTNAQALALRLHPQIASANYLVLAAQEVVKEARSGYFPQVNLYGTAVGANQEGTRILAGSLNNPSVYDRAAGGLQVNQLLTDFGRTANLTASSKFQAQAQNQELEVTREQVLLQVDPAILARWARKPCCTWRSKRWRRGNCYWIKLPNWPPTSCGHNWTSVLRESNGNKPGCCWKRRRTMLMPRWRRSPRRWVIASFTPFN